MMVAAPSEKVRHRILIVDDDEATRSGLKQFFERANYDVIAVGSYAEGRAALADSNPDLLIADVRLGEFNGLQLVATSTRPIPAIIVTGYADMVLEADAHRLGAEFLVKPVSPAALMSLVRQKLETPAEAVPVFSPTRRWERKRISSELAARVNDRPARILDISYGGLRFEMERRAESAVPSSFTLTVPSSGLSVPVDVVWTTRADEARWICGATVGESGTDTADAWHGLVDAVV
jgi:DNA-binding response OmpR family regulator